MTYKQKLLLWIIEIVLAAIFFAAIPFIFQLNQNTTPPIDKGRWVIFYSVAVLVILLVAIKEWPKPAITLGIFQTKRRGQLLVTLRIIRDFYEEKTVPKGTPLPNIRIGFMVVVDRPFFSWANWFFSAQAKQSLIMAASPATVFQPWEQNIRWMKGDQPCGEGWDIKQTVDWNTKSINQTLAPNATPRHHMIAGKSGAFIPIQCKSGKTVGGIYIDSSVDINPQCLKSNGLTFPAFYEQIRNLATGIVGHDIPYQCIDERWV